MPNYFAHQIFGSRVLRSLPPDLYTQLEGERAAFDLGCLGPDVLFFYRHGADSDARRESLTMHKRSAMPVFLRLRAAVEAGAPMSRGYAAGLLCHLVLDNGCHPWIGAQAARGGMTHLAMEAEFDRFLMERAGLRYQGRSYMPKIEDEAVFRAAARAFQKANARQIKQGFQAMARDTRLLARFYGTGLGKAANKICTRMKPLQGAVGVVLGKDPDAAASETNQILLGLLMRAEPTAAAQVVGFFRAVESGGPLSHWLERDFGGTAAPEEPEKPPQR